MIDRNDAPTIIQLDRDLRIVRDCRTRVTCGFHHRTERSALTDGSPKPGLANPVSAKRLIRFVIYVWRHQALMVCA